MSTQTTETLSRQVIEIISRQMQIPEEQISLDSQFITDLGFDSLDFVEFAMLIDEEFDLVIPDEEAGNILTVRDTVEAIQKLVS